HFVGWFPCEWHRASRKGHPRVLVFCVNGNLWTRKRGICETSYSNPSNVGARVPCFPKNAGAASRTKIDAQLCAGIARTYESVKSAGDHLHVIFGKICAHTKGAPRSLLALDATANADHHRFPLHLDLESSARALGHSCHGTSPSRFEWGNCRCFPER